MHTSTSTNKDQLLASLNTLITEGFTFYQKLIAQIELKFLKFKHDHFIDVNYFDRCQAMLKSSSSSSGVTLNPSIRSKEAKYALMCVQRSIICLGDLERYREMIFGSAGLQQRDYSQARLYYLKAMALAPKSSRAYHQLAILAIYTRRRLDTCYYYFRLDDYTVNYQFLDPLDQKNFLRSKLI